MKNKIFLLVTLMLVTSASYAQKNEKIDDAYFEYKKSRNVKGNAESILVMQALLKRANELTIKQNANVSYHLGRMYEEMELPDSAIQHYQNSLLGEPDYVVIHRALGFIYLAKTKPYIAQMNEAIKQKDADANAKALAQYKALIKKALPHLEKYQACENDEETLGMIKNLYKSVKDEEGLKTLENRLKDLSVKCVTLLEDE